MKLIGIIFICIGIVMILISANELYKINKKNNNIPLNNDIMRIITFILPELYGLIVGIFGMLLYIYN